MNYQLLKDAYYGTGGFASGMYLTRHKRETDDDYKFRQANAYYLNYFAPIVNALVDPIFKKPPIRNYSGELEDVIGGFLHNTDGSGTDMGTMMKQAAIMAKVYGVSFIVIDMSREAAARSMAELAQQRAYPYIRVVPPEDVVEYGMDKSGNLTYIELQEIASIDNGCIRYDRIRYGLDGWTSQGDTGLNGSGQYNLGRVPVVPLFSRLLEQKTMLPQSDMLPIAKTAQALYNHCSWLGEILRNQTFPLLTIPSLDAQDMTIGNNNALGYSPDCSHQPEFIAPPDGPASVLQTQITSLIQEMYRMASLSFMHQQGASESGLSRQWEFERTNQQLANFAANCSRAEESVLDIFARWLNRETDYKVTYPDNFGIIDVAGELREAQQVLDMGLMSGIKHEVLQRVIAAYCPNITDERYDELMTGLDREQADELNANRAEPDEE